MKKIIGFLEKSKKVKDDILDKKDKFVVMGILFTINMFIKHRKLNKYMLTGEGL